MNRYHYVIKNKLTNKVVDFKIYNVPNTPEEMAEIVRITNEQQPAANIYELVTDSTMQSAIELALRWKRNISMEDVLEHLHNIGSEVASVADEIRDHLEP